MEYKKKAFVLLILLGWISVASVAHAENFTGYMTSGRSLYQIINVDGSVSVSYIGEVQYALGADTRGGWGDIDNLAFTPDGHFYVASLGVGYDDIWGDPFNEHILYELDIVNLSLSDIVTTYAPFGSEYGWCTPYDINALAVGLSGKVYNNLVLSGPCAPHAIMTTTLVGDSAEWWSNHGYPYPLRPRIVAMDVAPSGSIFGWDGGGGFTSPLRGLVIITENGLVTQVDSNQPPQIDGETFEGDMIAIAFTPGGKLIGIGNEVGVTGSVFYEIDPQTEGMTRIATVPALGSEVAFEIVGLADNLDLEIVDPACTSKTSCDGKFLRELSDGKVVPVDDVDALASASVSRTGIVTDGVTQLLLRVKADAPVTFTLNGPWNDSVWGTLMLRKFTFLYFSYS